MNDVTKVVAMRPLTGVEQERLTKRGRWEQFKCGCERDDGSDSKHTTDGRSRADTEHRLHHYPKNKPAENWCITCASIRPCSCDKKRPDVKKGKKR